MPVLDLTGHRYGHLIVLKFAKLTPDFKATWLCRCDCGKRKIIRAAKLRIGKTKSCGCVFRNGPRTKHGASRRGKVTREFECWVSMHQRCKSPNNNRYYCWGGRGIRVCKRWNSFENFLADMGPRPKGFSLERINNNGNYTPSNCKWIPRGAQSRNRRPYNQWRHAGRPPIRQ